MTVDEPEIVRESIAIRREVPISQILPVATASANFEAKAEVRDTIAALVAALTLVAGPGGGIITDRVGAASAGDTGELSNVNVYGTNLRSASDWGGVLGDEFADFWAGLERALELKAAIVVLISDGDPIRGGITAPNQILTLI